MATSRIDPAPPLRFDQPNWVADPPLPRDQQPSHRLHEPEHLSGTIDPVSGHDIFNPDAHPYVVDGNLTIHFECEINRRQFLDMPFSHPYSHDLGELPEDADRGG